MLSKRMTWFGIERKEANSCGSFLINEANRWYGRETYNGVSTGVLDEWGGRGWLMFPSALPQTLQNTHPCLFLQSISAVLLLSLVLVWQYGFRKKKEKPWSTLWQKWRHFYEGGWRKKSSRSGIENSTNDTFWPKMWKMLEEKQHLLLRGYKGTVSSAKFQRKWDVEM